MSIASITESAHYITFKLGDEIFAIPVAQVREVLDPAQIVDQTAVRCTGTLLLQVTPR